MKKSLTFIGLAAALLILITGCTPAVAPDPVPDTTDSGNQEKPQQNTATDRVQNLDFI